MSISITLQAFISTFAMLCIVGPICMTVINTTIIHGFRIGLFAGLGVATADCIYIMGASFAIAALETFLKSKIVVVIGLLGGSFLYYLAYRFWTTKVSLDSREISSTPLKSFVSLFFLTITGPTTMITYSVIFSSFIGNEEFTALSAIIGGCSSAILFYLLLVSVVSVLRAKMSVKVINVINKVATIVIVLFATKLFYSSIKILIS